MEPPSPRITASLDTEDHGINHGINYKRFIRACHSHHPDATGYYQQLIDYIEPSMSSHSSPLQTAKIYELRSQVAVNLTPESPYYPVARVDYDQVDADPRIIVVEGFLSPHCIAQLGSRLSLRPEFFLRHLDIKQKSSQQQRFYEVPTLPSRQDNIVHIRLVTLSKALHQGNKKDSYSESRSQAKIRHQALEKQLFTEKRYGESRRRKVHIHNSQFSSTEYMVSFSVSSQESSQAPGFWEGVFLLDSGREHVEDYRSTSTSYRASGRLPGSLPVIPYNSYIDTIESTTDMLNRDLPSTLPLFHPFKNCHVQSMEELELLRADPFFLLSRVLTTAALSWNQLICFLEDDIKNCQRAGAGQFSIALEQLRWNSSLIDRIRRFIEEPETIINSGGCMSWPKSDKLELLQLKAHIIEMLQLDYKALKARCTQLSRSCEIAGSILVSSAQLEEAQKGIGQARQVHALTRLAFVFIPMSFMASIFSMSVKELQSHPSIWVYFVVSVPLSSIAILVAVWSDIKLLERCRPLMLWKR